MIVNGSVMRSYITVTYGCIHLLGNNWSDSFPEIISSEVSNERIINSLWDASSCNRAQSSQPDFRQSLFTQWAHWRSLQFLGKAKAINPGMNASDPFFWLHSTRMTAWLLGFLCLYQIAWHANTLMFAH